MQANFYAVPGIPDIKAGDDIVELILSALASIGKYLESGDILVIAHKIVSKAENRFINFADINPSREAIDLAQKVRKDPRKVEIILRESKRVIRAVDRSGLEEGILITEHKRGYISANACIDESNIEEENTALLLPLDPDASACNLRNSLEKKSGLKPIGVVISDTFGRAWRIGQVNVAIGLAGVPAAHHLLDTSDAYGNRLRVTQPAFADEITAASGLLMKKEGKCPVIVFKGLDWEPTNNKATDLIRPEKEDLFR